MTVRTVRFQDHRIHTVSDSDQCRLGRYAAWSDLAQRSGSGIPSRIRVSIHGNGVYMAQNMRLAPCGRAGIRMLTPTFMFDDSMTKTNPGRFSIHEMAI